MMRTAVLTLLTALALVAAPAGHTAVIPFHLTLSGANENPPVASPGTGHAQGLERMDRAGVELIGVKGLGYEWLGTAERATAFGVASEHDTPAGIVL